MEVVVDTACYLKNRSPTLALVDKTPHEVRSGKNPSIAHFRVFGCDACMHVPKEKRSKLDNKVEKCIFVSYKDGIKESMNKTHFRLRHGFGHMVLVAHGIDAHGICM